MNKNVLVITFHFPPSNAAAVQRTLKMAQYLEEFGWQATILTSKTNAYDTTDNTQHLPSNLKSNIYRSAALDVHKHFSIYGKHFSWMKSIDRWTSWVPTALIKANDIQKHFKFDAVISTSPIPSAHIIASFISKKYNIPWLADYQDPFSYHYEKTSKLKSYFHNKIDKDVIKFASAITFATQQTKDLYAHKLLEEAKDKLHVIENGFDEQAFDNLDTYIPQSVNTFDSRKFSMYYSGVLYNNGRNPQPLFAAISTLKEQNVLNHSNFELKLQGAGSGSQFNTVIEKLDINNLVSFLPNVPFLESLYNMSKADALVLIQDAIFNLQIPGKLYEYIGAKRPILAITPPEGATAEESKKIETVLIASDKREIIIALKNLINAPPKNNESVNIQQFSRYSKTEAFSKLLNKISSHQNGQ